MAPAPWPEALIPTLCHALVAYDQTYGLPDDAADRQAVVGALLCSLPEAATMLATVESGAQLIETVTHTDPATVTTAALTAAHSALATAAYQRRQQLETDLRDTLDAYLQQVSPNLTTTDLEAALAAAVPLVSNGPITAAEARSLIRQVAPILAPQAARAGQVGSRAIELAQTLATVLRQRPFEQAVCETVIAYGQQFQQQAGAVGETLIETAIEAILRNQQQFGFEFDVDLSLTDRQLMVEQVSFKLNILQASPPPSKTALEIAQQIHSEVDRFRVERAAELGTDGAAGLLSDDGMSISSGWQFEDDAEEAAD